MNRERCLHDYEIEKQNTNGLLEVCRKCKKKLKTNISIWGTINTEGYNHEHRRDMLQPGNRLFEKEYGEANESN